MVRDACDILEFDDKDAIRLITNKSITPFCHEIESRLNANPDNLQLRYLYLIIGDANYQAGGLGGDEINNKIIINRFRLGLKKAYFGNDRLDNLYGNNPEKLRSKKNLINHNDMVYLDKIDNLFKECQDFNKLEAEGRLNLYNGIVFKPLMENKKRNASPIPKFQLTEPKDDKQIWDDCVKDFDGILDFIQKYPENRYVSVADEYLWNLVDRNDQGSLQKYLDATGENAIHKKEAKEMLKAFILELPLKQCRSLDDYEKVLEQYCDDPIIRDEVYEKCWKFCEDRGNDYDYMHYISIIDRFGGSLHYKEAQQKIEKYDEAVPQKKDHSILWLFVLAMVLFPIVLFFFWKKKKPDRKIKIVNQIINNKQKQ